MEQTLKAVIISPQTLPPRPAELTRHSCDYGHLSEPSLRTVYIPDEGGDIYFLLLYLRAIFFFSEILTRSCPGTWEKRLYL